jgi:dihydropyrimidinase
MAHDLVLRNARVVTPEGVIAGGVSIEGGVIAAVGSTDELGSGRQEIDLEGDVLFPGLIDPHVHYGLGDVISDDGMANDFALASRDCAVGGVTTIATTTLIGPDPLNDQFDRAIACAAGRSLVDFKLDMPVVARSQIAEIPRMVERGAVSYKFFTGYQGEQAVSQGMNPDGIPPDFFYEACELLKQAGAPAFAKIHAEEPTVRELIIARRRQDPPGGELVAWADASPRWGESVQVYTYGQIAAEIGVPIYIVHVSLAHTLDTIRQLRADGAEIIGETLALFLSTTAEEMDAKQMGARAKIQPPIRHESDRVALWDGIADGTVTIVGTDSLCFSAAFKDALPFWDVRVGVNNQYADTLPLMVTQAGTDDDALLLLARVLSENAARRYGIYPRKGAIAVGADGDMVSFSATEKGQLGVARLRGSADYSLWEGREAIGIPKLTILRGNVVMREGEIVTDSPPGQFVPTVS